MREVSGSIRTLLRGCKFLEISVEDILCYAGNLFLLLLKVFKMIEYFTDILKELLFLYFIVNLTNIVLEKWKS